MGHMKKLFGLLMVLGSLFIVGRASAHEGMIDLTSAGVSCKGVSIFQDGYYKVNGRCDGLTYPYETLYNRYVLWGKTTNRGVITRIAEIDRGYFQGNISEPFESMYITAEQDANTRKMSDKQIASGYVTAFSFDKSKTTIVPAVSTTTTAKTTTTTAATTVAAASSTTGAVIGKIVSSLLIVILVIVGLAIGASLLFRNRGSVSSH